MISCTEYKGQKYTPISNFECLAKDVASLPKNRNGLDTIDITYDYTNSNEVNVYSNNFINNLKFNNLPSDIVFIKIASIKLISGQKEELLEYNENIDFGGFVQYGFLNPYLKKLCVNDNNIGSGLDLSKIENVDEIQIKFNFMDKDNIIKSNKTYNLKINKKEIINTENCSNYYSIKTNFNNNFYIANGSVAFIMDTGDVYKFDEEYDRWLKI